VKLHIPVTPAHTVKVLFLWAPLGHILSCRLRKYPVLDTRGDAGTPRSLSSPLSMSPRAHLSPRTREAALNAVSPEQRRRASFSDVPRSPAASHRASLDRRGSVERPSRGSPPAPSVGCWWLQFARCCLCTLTEKEVMTAADTLQQSSSTANDICWF
jgi:hypothetical protein